jgi:signal peptide peptidase SppA
MYRALPHILARIFGPPLMIAPAKLDKMLLGLHAAMQQRGSLLPVIEARRGDDVNDPRAVMERGYRIDNGVATVPVHGVLVRRAGQITPDSTELQSYESIGRTMRNARADRDVRGILLDVDSPGGEAGGIFDLAAEIKGAREIKPVWAIAQDDSMSAAYLLTSAAERIWTTQTGGLGSIGVVALHADQSAFDAAEGIRYTYLYRGAHKIDGNPHAPLTDDARAVIQTEVDRLYNKLVEVVAGNRGVDAARIRKTEAGIYFGEHALTEGLADQIGTIDEAHAALAAHVQSKGARMDTTTQPAADSGSQPASPATPAVDSNVVQLRVDEARKLLREEMTEIAALCTLAKQPQLAAGFIAEGLTKQAVMVKLQEAQAAAAAKSPIQAIDTSEGTGAAVDHAGKARAAAAERMTAMYGRRA